jgi:hypothetical protein
MPEGGSVRVWRRAVGLILCLGLLCGCSQRAEAMEDLIKALGDAHSAIASSILAIELYEHERSTRAVTETVLRDMAGQIVDVASALESVKIDSDQTQSDRDAALAAVHAGVTAVLASRDELKTHSAVGNIAELESAARQVDSVLAELRGSR